MAKQTAGSFVENIKTVAKNCGVCFDSKSLYNHVIIRPIQSFTDTETSLHALISLDLDYCTRLFNCLNENSMNYSPDNAELNFQAFG